MQKQKGSIEWQIDEIMGVLIALILIAIVLAILIFEGILDKSLLDKVI